MKKTEFDFIFQLLIILRFLLPIVAIQIYPNVSELVIENGNTLTLICSNEDPVGWSHSKESQNFTEVITKKNVNGIYYSNLTIDHVKFEDSGYFTCQSQTNTSSVAQIYIYCSDLNSIFLNVTALNESYVVTVNSKEKATVDFVAGVQSFPEITTKTWYDFQKEKFLESKSSDKHDIIDDPHQIKLRIKNIRVDDAGTYQLKVNNSWITETINFTLIVEAEPSAYIWKNFTFGILKSNYTLNCYIGGYPTPQITWSVMNCDDYPICGNNTFQIQPISQQKDVFETAYMIKSIFHFEATQNMIIRCDANNSLGSSSASTLLLLSDYESGFLMQEKYSKPIIIGDYVQLTCTASKYLYTNNFTWGFRKKKIIPSQEMKITNMATNFSHISTLSIANIQKNHSGIYICQTLFKNSSLRKDDLGRSKRCYLTVEDAKPPSIVQPSLNNGTLDVVRSFEFLIIFLVPSMVGVVIWYLRKLNKKKKELQKILEEYNLKNRDGSDVSDLDSQVDVNEQTDLLPYSGKFEFPKEKLNLGDKLGSGEFGVVYKAVADGIIEKDVKTVVAVKKAKLKKNIQVLVSELKILIYAEQHPNVVNLLGACTKDLINGDLTVIVEFCTHGNLQNFLRDQRKKENFVNQIIQMNKNDKTDLPVIGTVRYENVSREDTREIPITNSLIEETPNAESDKPIKTIDLIRWSMQTARGMEYLANRKILHGDLAARNILLAEGYTVKICDFGFSKKMYLDDEYKSRKTVFALKWMAIESIEDHIFSTKSDVWSFGVVLWEIFTLGVSPYPGLHENLYKKLKSGYRMEKPNFATNQIYNIMKECWNEDPELRPSFTKLSEELASLQKESQFVDLVNTDKTSTAEIGTDECYTCMKPFTNDILNEEEMRIVSNPCYSCMEIKP